MTGAWRRIAAAMLVSAIAHAIVVSGRWLEVTEPPHDDLKPLQARLELPAVTPAEIPDARPVPERRAPRPTRLARAAVPAAPMTTGSYAMPVEPVPSPVAAEPPAPPAQVEAPVVASVPVSTLSTELPLLRPLPRRGRITFVLYYGDDRASVGRAVQTWEAGPDRYTLTSEAQTTGLIDVFRPQRWRYVSRGAITPRGLQPEIFTMDRTRRGRHESARAEFDWTTGNLAFGNPQPSRSARLRDGAQDLISMIFQLAISSPAPGRLTLPVTTGSRYEQYELEVLPEEMIETPLGTLRTLPVRQIRRPGEDGIEIWLAAEYRYLPVRIRFVDRDGDAAGEQLVAEIQVSDQ